MKKLNKDIIKNKPKKIVSSEEALKDVLPLFTEDELKDIKDNNKHIIGN